MENYNFFEPYIEPPEKFNYERVIWITIIAILVVAMAVLFVTQYYKIKGLENEITALDEQINSPILQKALLEVDQVEAQMLELEGTYTELMMLDQVAANHLSFDYNIFKELNAWVPENAFLINLNYINKALYFDGYGDSVDTVALFQHQLSANDSFYNVNLDSVSKENDNYSFSMAMGVSPMAKIDRMAELESELLTNTQEESEGQTESQTSEEVEVEAENAETQSKSE